MRFQIGIHAGPRSLRHTIDLEPGRDTTPAEGQLAVSIDNGTARRVDWVQTSPGVYSLILDGRSYEAHVLPETSEREPRLVSYKVVLRSQEYRVEIHDPRARHGKE